MESVLNHYRVKNIPVCKCIISVTGFGHVSYSWPGESRIVPKRPLHKFAMNNKVTYRNNERQATDKFLPLMMDIHYCRYRK